jgi:hypothetical protein
MKAEEKVYVIKEKGGQFKIEEWKEKLPPIMKCGHQANSIWHSPKELEKKRFGLVSFVVGKKVG